MEMVNQKLSAFLKNVMPNMKQLFQVLFLLSAALMGCMAEKNYQSYEDPKNKGEAIFLNDAKVCKEMAHQNTRQIEGSEGAGERFHRKNSLFLSCMKNNDWLPKR